MIRSQTLSKLDITISTSAGFNLKMSSEYKTCSLATWPISRPHWLVLNGLKVSGHFNAQWRRVRRRRRRSLPTTLPTLIRISPSKAWLRWLSAQIQNFVHHSTPLSLSLSLSLSSLDLSFTVKIKIKNLFFRSCKSGRIFEWLVGPVERSACPTLI